MKISLLHTIKTSSNPNYKQSMTNMLGLDKIPKQERAVKIREEQKKDLKDMKQALAIGFLIAVAAFVTGIIKKKSVKSLILPSIELGAALSFPVYFCKMLVSKSQD